MTLSPFVGPKCQEIRAHLDSYLSGELLVETTESVQTHLGRCAACRAELDRRSALVTRLREVLTEPTDTSALERRIDANLTDRRPVWARPAYLLAAAAALVLSVGLWRSLPGSAADTRQPGRPGSDAVPAAALAPATGRGAAGPALARVDAKLYSDTAISHTYCALKRDMPVPPPSRTLAETHLEQYAGLLAAVSDDLAGYTLADAHICPNGDRRYAHLIFRRGDDTSSVFVTEKLDGDLPDGDGILNARGASVHVRREGGFAISAVETDNHVGLIVQDADRPDPAFPTDALAVDLAGYLKQFNRQALGVGR